LFAREGVEQVALTRIVSSSRQKNRSALHYHFGSREAVVAAVLDRRLKHVNALRHRMLDEAEQSDAGLAGLVRRLIRPLASVVVDEPWGSDYVRVLAQVTFRPRLLGERGVDDANVSSVRRFRRLVESALPDLPRAVLAQRHRWLTDSVVLAIARWTHQTPKSQQTPATLDDLTEGFIAYGVAAMSAPPKALERPLRRSVLRQRVG
jgi:AcrR family transcriptional regulator